MKKCASFVPQRPLPEAAPGVSELIIFLLEFVFLEMLAQDR